jgi:hypothetical protein
MVTDPQIHYPTEDVLAGAIDALAVFGVVLCNAGMSSVQSWRAPSPARRSRIGAQNGPPGRALIVEALATFFAMPVRGDRGGIRLVETDR